MNAQYLAKAAKINKAKCQEVAEVGDVVVLGGQSDYYAGTVVRAYRGGDVYVNHHRGRRSSDMAFGTYRIVARAAERG